VKDKFSAFGVAVETSTPDELAALVKSGLVARGELIKAANIQPE
jgi:tripartite-type tricarboxylate transporter receptor subunit TctC